MESESICLFEQRMAMVRVLERYGITDSRVLQAMSEVKRHLFIPREFRKACDPYGDHPCHIGSGQTISQPFIVAYMIERMELSPSQRVLEIGTGSGYAAAVLCSMGMDVSSIEILPELAAHARRELAGTSVRLRTGDGNMGWPEMSPFDRVIVSCSPEEIPHNLTEQLNNGGKMILPLGSYMQRLVIVEKEKGNISLKNDLPVRFVPMVSDRQPSRI